MIASKRWLAVLGALFFLRLVAGAVLPLSADEAYYWLWSQHLAAGYYDHPPAIALLIAAGTVLFGKTAFGVRFCGILLSFAATGLVWHSAAILLKDKRAGLRAALLFNATLMVTVEMLAATPDTPQIFTAAAFLWAIAKVVETGNGRWWLAVGIAGGLGLLSKYSTLFLGLGALVWLFANPPARRWLVSPWPYLGALLAGLIFLPNIVWNAQHGWATFAFQFGRIAGHQLTLKYLGELIGAEAALASPFVLVLAVMGICAARRRDPAQSLIACLIWPSIGYFLIHALHDRVQGNWPCYLFPALVLAALAAAADDWTGWKKPLAARSAKLALPVALVLVAAGYAQALLGVVPMGRKDPLARLLAIGMPHVVRDLGELKVANHAERILTTDYASTGWFAFYSPYPVVSLGEDMRWPNAAPLSAADFAQPALYIAEDRHDLHRLVAASFVSVSEIARIDRMRDDKAIAHYLVYRVSGPKGTAFGRMP